jgi:hypothetical protein
MVHDPVSPWLAINALHHCAKPLPMMHHEKRGFFVTPEVGRLRNTFVVLVPGGQQGTVRGVR